MANSIMSTQNTGNFSPAMIEQFKQFKNTFKGNPKQMVMGMLQQGKISNGQLQQAMNMAKQFQSLLK